MSRTHAFLAVLLLAALACNMPRLVIADPTHTPAPTLPPTAPPPPTLAPSPTVPPLPAVIPPVPTRQPTQPPPTLAISTPAAPPPAETSFAVTEPPPPTVGPTATEGYPTPEARALFAGAFTGGQLAFRIGANSITVIPKSVTLKGAACKEGGKVNQAIDFEPPPEYAIEKGRFLITYDNMVTIFGQFQSRDRVLGNITLKLALDSSVCTIGPLPFAATP